MGAPSAVTSAHAPVIHLDEHFPQESDTNNINNSLSAPLNEKDSSNNENNIRNQDGKNIRTPSAPRGSSSNGTFTK